MASHNMPPQHGDRQHGTANAVTGDRHSDHGSETTFGGNTVIGPTVNQTVANRELNRKGEADHQGKREITEEECEAELGFAFPSWKKWYILTVIFLVQTSMNFNTSLYSNGIGGIHREFNVSEQAARAGAAIFLIAYGFGCELWAPWSEEFGRKPILQASLLLVNIFTLPVALAPNFGCLLAGRFFGGLSTAGGSVTLGMIADLYDSDNQHYAVAYIVFSSVGGSILGPIVGGFVEQFLEWRWTIWIQLIFGGFVQLLHLFTVPETRTTIMLDRIAKRRRKSGQDPNVYGPDEIVPFRERFNAKELMYTLLRPFRMFLTEPIVLVLSLLSGFSDALIFMCIQSFVLVYGDKWGFSAYQVGLSFIPIGVGYVIGWLAFIPSFQLNKKRRQANPDDEYAQYESRLKLLLYLAPCLPIGLIIFAWTSSGPPIPWVASMVGTALIGVANYVSYLPCSILALDSPNPSYAELLVTGYLSRHNRLHDRRLRPILGLGDRRQRLGQRRVGRYPHCPSHALLHQHRRREGHEPRICVHDPLLHLECARPRNLRHLLEGSRAPPKLPLRAVPRLWVGRA